MFFEQALGQSVEVRGDPVLDAGLDMSAIRENRDIQMEQISPEAINLTNKLLNDTNMFNE